MGRVQDISKQRERSSSNVRSSASDRLTDCVWGSFGYQVSFTVGLKKVGNEQAETHLHVVGFTETILSLGRWVAPYGQKVL